MWILLIFAVLVTALLLFLIGLTIYHRYRLSVEYKLLKAPGQLVEVNGHKMHVYLRGSHANANSPLLVFLLGSGDPFPLYTFRPLYEKLSKNYRIALVERAGFGYSDETNQSRDTDTVLSETRKALSLVDEQNRYYVLFPHSAAGLEALRWAQSFPDEILGIVGLDMAIPQAVLTSKYNPTLIQLVQTFAYIGIHRLIGVNMMNGLVDLSAIEAFMTSEEKQQMKMLFYKTLYKNEGKESPHLWNTAALIEKCGIPNIPMILFCSDKFEMMGSKQGSWIEHQTKFALDQHSPLLLLEAGHLLMSEKSDIIAQHAHPFITTLLDK